MGDRTVTRKEHEAGTKAILDIFNGVHGGYRDKITEYADAYIKAAGLTLEPPEILPDVSVGEWSYKPGTDGGIYAGDKQIAQTIQTTYTTKEVNAKLMAGSKKLVELVVEWLCAFGGTEYDEANTETQAIIDQIEKMGVNVSEFKGNGDE